MVETIAPVVYGGRARWSVAVALHALGATVTAALFGAALGWLGGALGAPWGRAGALGLAAAALLYAVAEMPRVEVRVPQLRQQVPDWWRTFFAWPVAAALYGAGLGIGFFTYLTNGTLVAVAVGAAASGRPGLGALVMAPFGLARGLSPLMAARVDGPEAGRTLVDRLVGSSGRCRAVVNGGALALVSVLALEEALRFRGGWAGLASAAIAVVFAWAAGSKVAEASRWRRTLAAHALSPSVARAAGWVVPSAEAVVPLLVVLGYPRAASGWALILVALFTVAVVRVRIRLGSNVPCGCFGGRDAIDLRSALARNAGLSALALLGLVAGVDTPTLIWPGAPGPEAVIPIMLAAVGVLVGGFTAWRTTVWLGRGRRA